MFLFAGVSYMLMPGADVTPPAATGQVATVENDMPASSADPMPTASTGDEAANVSVGDEPMPDDQPADTAALAATEPGAEPCR